MSARKPYHHGSLHAALIEAALQVLEAQGLAGLTLRETARVAGVSHAAPKNHFGDLTGLLSEVAAIGFRRFSAALTEAGAAADTPRARLDALGRAYVGFATAQPGLFLLMFRSEQLDLARPALREAYLEARNVLGGGVAARMGIEAGAAPTPAQSAAMVGAWSLVHGFAMLLIDHRLDPLVRQQADGRWESLLDAVFGALPPRGGPPPAAG